MDLDDIKDAIEFKARERVLMGILNNMKVMRCNIPLEIANAIEELEPQRIHVKKVWPRIVEYLRNENQNTGSLLP